ncbi:ATP-binding protein [Acidianus sp. HS-5]|uniref:ATP-binding protein n=1 Tax=Acidianus sp. HS-5 TaxID=2886040 RepID=UPI001F39AAEC|nr:ATP-binding protein [Acidianus sp. HS-5]BDC17765.1 AAA family ATPase [Acidianus sp. HS-5]
MNIEEIKAVLKEQKEEAEELLKGRIIPRDVPSLLDYLSIPNVLAITGVRRSGKSTLSLLLLKGQNFAYVNFDDERLRNLTAEELSRVEEGIYSIYGDVRYLLFDEIQNVKGWEPFISRLRRAGKRIIATGSNSKLLSGELSTSLTGRHIDYMLFPFSFREYLRFNSANVEGDVFTTREKAVIKDSLRKYLEVGGFPEVLALGSRAMLNSIYNDILFKDVVIRLKIRRIEKFKDFSTAVISLYSSEVSFNRLSRMLKIDYKTVEEWFSGIVESYLVYPVGRYSGKVSSLGENKKVYVVDPGIIHDVVIKKDFGRIMENAVAIHLLRKNQGKGIYYVRGDDYEVDFYDEKNGELIQVTYDEEEIKERETTGLLKASSILGARKLKIITWEKEEEIVIGNKRIEVKPLWKFLLMI